MKNPRREIGIWGFCFISNLNFDPGKVKIITFPLVVLSFSPLAEGNFSFLAEEEPDAARAEAPASVQGLAWLLAWVEEQRVCFEVAALAADALAAELVAGAAAEALVADAAVAALAADAPAAGPVADVAAEELVADATVVLAAGALVAELVAGVAAAELGPVYFETEVPAADALAAEPVAGAAAGPELACSALAEALAADELAAELAAGARAAVLPVWRQAAQQAVGCDWAAAELGQELAARRADRRAAGCDSVEHFAGPQRADEHRWAVVAARR
jgi:hypothetical protein